MSAQSGFQQEGEIQCGIQAKVTEGLLFLMRLCRTSPTATAPRYQEDYELGALQLKALDAAKAAKEAKA